MDEVPEGWCDIDHPEHEWKPGDLECRRCGADLSEWDESEEY